MYKGGHDANEEEGNGKTKKILCIGSIILLIIAAIVLIVVLVPKGGSDSGGGTKPDTPVKPDDPVKPDEPTDCTKNPDGPGCPQPDGRTTNCAMNEFHAPGTNICTRCPAY